jgi:hypothetical protein
MLREASVKAVRHRFALFILLAALTLATSCDKKFPYPELLSEQEGKYYVLYVGAPESNTLNHPQVILKLSQREVTGYSLIWSLENAKKQYPKLELERAPMYVIFDTQNMVLMTEDEQKVVDFLFTD